MDNDFFKFSSEDTDLLVTTMEKLRDDLRFLAETLDQVASEMEEEEALKFEEAAISVISRIKLRAVLCGNENCPDAHEGMQSYSRLSANQLNIYRGPH